jgi:RNA polymerase sigma-70 factor (ECF subfamily)
MGAGQMAATMTGAGWQSAAREDAGFAVIVRQHQSMVYSIAWHFFRNRALAEEISQDVFLALFRNLDGIETPGHLEAWLRRTASNRCIDAWRKKGHKEEIPMEGLPEPSHGMKLGDPMLRETLRKLVASLPETQRMVMILKYGEDLDPDEIAAALGMPVRTVWSHLRRGVGMLKEKLGRVMEI